MQYSFTNDTKSHIKLFLANKSVKKVEHQCFKAHTYFLKHSQIRTLNVVFLNGEPTPTYRLMKYNNVNI